MRRRHERRPFGSSEGLLTAAGKVGVNVKLVGGGGGDAKTEVLNRSWPDEEMG